jgi:uncharacterized protein (DUF488 family)
MPVFDLFSIGHSNIPAERFMAMLQGAGVKTIADVRTTPASRFSPWFSAKPLATLLARHGIGYVRHGDTLGGRPRDAKLYRDGVADYEAMARQPEFQAGIAGLLAAAAQCRVCIMCAEREPLDCHRCLLVARALVDRGLSVGHLLHDGTVESHRSTEQRLLAPSGVAEELFVTGQDERLAAAYRRRARAFAYRAKTDVGGSGRGANTKRRP